MPFSCPCPVVPMTVMALACVAMIDNPAAHHGIFRPPA